MVMALDSQSTVHSLKPLGGSKVNSDFYPSTQIKWITGTLGELVVKTVSL